MPSRAATTAEAYSQGSRRIMSGRQSRTACSIAASIAVAARRPNSSRLPSTDASSGGRTGSCSRMGRTCASDGSPPARKGWPVALTMPAREGGPTTSVCPPSRRAWSRNGTSGRRWPPPPSEHAARTRTHRDYDARPSAEARLSTITPKAGAAGPGGGSHPRWQALERVLHGLRRQVEVGHLAGLVVAVGGKVKQAMSAQGGQDHLLLAGLLAAQRLLDGGGERVGGLGGGQDALGPGEPQDRKSTRLNSSH